MQAPNTEASTLRPLSPAAPAPHSAAQPTETVSGYPNVSEAPLAPSQKKRTLLGLSPPHEVLYGVMREATAAASPVSAGAQAPPSSAPSTPAPMAQTAPGPFFHDAPPGDVRSDELVGEQAPMVRPDRAEPHASSDTPAATGSDAPAATGSDVARHAPSFETNPSFDPPAPAAAKQGRWLLGLAAALLLGLIAFLLWWTPPRPLTAQLKLTDAGREQLLLSCDNCPTGSRVHIGSASASFEDGQAVLMLEAPLAVGDNALQARLERPGLGRDEDVALTVPVQYRLSTDLSELASDEPSMAVEVEAVPGTEAELNGQAVSFENGRARAVFPFALDNHGQHAELVSTEEQFAYRIRTPDGEVHEATLTQRVSVPPLVVFAPGKHLIVEQEKVHIEGRTAPGASVTADGRALAVDEQGSFGATVPLAGVGRQTVTVRATATGHAARVARLQVTRVEDLAQYAQTFQGEAVRRYVALRQRLDAGQQPTVALPGRVESTASSVGTTTLLLSVSSGCSTKPCLAKVIHGAPLDLEQGQRLSVFGESTRLVQSPIGGREVPEIISYFVLQ